MALSNYTELQASIASWLNRDDLTSQIPDFILMAEARFNRDFINEGKTPPREMEGSADLTVNAQSVALPSDFLRLRRLYLNTSPIRPLQYVSPHTFWQSWAGSQTGKPEVFTIEGANALFGSTPDGSYTGKLSYYQKIPDLATNSTNWLLTLSPDMYLYAALLCAEPFLMNDARLQTWTTLYAEAEDSLLNRGDSHGGVINYQPKVSP